MRKASILTIIIVAVVFMPVSATIINIPDDYPTIQQGIDASNDGDTVLVAEGQYFERINIHGKNILLTSEFIIDGDTLHIQNTIIDADTLEIDVVDTGSVVCFVNGETATSIIQGFTIKNGIGTSISIFHRMGGGIYCSNNSSPTIANNIICDNFSSAGGGISCIENSNPVIINNVIRENEEHGIYTSQSSPTISNNTISSNRAEYGSGIFCGSNSDAAISYNIIRGNYGGLCGGGIFCRESNPLIIYNIIYENWAYDWGGGICCDEANPAIVNNTISRNTALANGGGIFCLNNASPTITNTIVWANSPREIGLRSGGSPIITYCDIRGGWEGDGNIDIDPLFLSAFEGDYNVCSQSPCIDAGDPALTDPDGSRSDVGFYYADHPDCEVGKCIFVSTSGNDTTGHGTPQNPFRTIQHGIEVSYSSDTILVENGTYIENINLTAKNIFLTSNYIFSGDTLDVQNTIIDGDSDTTVVTFLSCDSTTAITGFTIRNGYGWSGGGIYCGYSDLMISSNLIRENSAASGGGILCSYGNPIINNNTINENSADYAGGGIKCYYSNTTIRRNTIYGNSAIIGGGIFCNRFSTITNNIISENSANKGGGIYFLGTNSTFINNTLYRNLAVSSGGGIYCNYSDVLVTNTILWCDSAQEEGNEIHLEGTSSPIFTYNDIQGGWEGEGNIDTDPLFRTPENGDFHLMAIECGDPYDSPCIDAGHPDILDSLLDCDWGLGELRSDMGAYGGGDSIQVGITEKDIEVPRRFNLSQNYPNPFNISTTISYTLPYPSDVTIDIYNILGRKVETLVNAKQEAGHHQIVWNAEEISTGIYFYKIQAGSYVETKKMVLLK